VGLAAWYRFEATTGLVCDSSGNGNHGTAQGSGYTRGVPGKLGNGISFDGTDGRVMVPSSTTLDMLTGGTIELWIKFTVPPCCVTTYSTVSRGTGNNDNNVLQNTACGNMQTIYTYNFMTTNVTSNCNAIASQTWTHIAVTNDGTTLSMYVNAALNTTWPGGDMGALNADLYIGRREQGIFAMVGELDEVKWWTIVRTPAEICTDAGGTLQGTSCVLPS
jgi:biopolymer transport protein ExbB